MIEVLVRELLAKPIFYNLEALQLGGRFTEWRRDILLPYAVDINNGVITGDQILIEAINRAVPLINTWELYYRWQLLDALEQLRIVLDGNAADDTHTTGEIHGGSPCVAVAATRKAFIGCFPADTLMRDRETGWVLDGACDGCQECHTKFNFINRRHHCRICGRCICSNCSCFYFNPYLLDYSLLCKDCAVKYRLVPGQNPEELELQPLAPSQWH